MAFDLLPDVLVPVGLGLLSGVGATTYTNYLAAKRETRNIDDVAEAAIRAYENALRNYAVYAVIANSLPGHGDDAMQGSDNFWKRAELVSKVLSRGLRPRGEKVRDKVS